MMPASLRLFAAAAAAVMLTGSALGWSYTGHRAVVQLAFAALPADFPDFAREPVAADRIAFLTNVPDSWRNVDPWLKQVGPSWTDHFLDIEQLPAAGLNPKTVSSFRYDFVVAFAAGRAAHAQNFPVIDPARNRDRSDEWPGFSPWAIAEWTHKLRSAFGYLKAYEELGGTPVEIANARADAIYAMGILAHYVGDAAQPLHTTNNYNGWTGPNPHGYTAWNGIHSWIDGGLIAKAGITADTLLPRITLVEALPATNPADGRDPIFIAAMDYILASHEHVETLYQLEKAGKLGNGDPQQPAEAPPVSAEGRAFVEDRLVTGGQMLAKLWVTAWKSAPVDTYLRSQLAKRSATAQPAPATATKP